MKIGITFLLILVIAGCTHHCGTERKMREEVLRENLTRTREVIADYHLRKGKYPKTLQHLVDEGYLRRVPVDPITHQSDSWIETRDVSPDKENGGIKDIRSGASGKTLDGTPYNEL